MRFHRMKMMMAAAVIAIGASGCIINKISSECPHGQSNFQRGRQMDSRPFTNDGPHAWGAAHNHPQYEHPISNTTITGDWMVGGTGSLNITGDSNALDLTLVASAGAKDDSTDNTFWFKVGEADLDSAHGWVMPWDGRVTFLSYGFKVLSTNKVGTSEMIVKRSNGIYPNGTVLWNVNTGSINASNNSYFHEYQTPSSAKTFTAGDTISIQFGFDRFEGQLDEFIIMLGVAKY